MLGPSQSLSNGLSPAGEGVGSGSLGIGTPDSNRAHQRMSERPFSKTPTLTRRTPTSMTENGSLHSREIFTQNSAASPRPDNALLSSNDVQVFVRLRPLNDRELTAVGDHKSLEQRGISSLHLFVNNRHHDYRFDDVVGADGTQEDMFTLVGKPMVSNVMQGYNACCFAYGQTSSGKTYTMHGDLSPGPNGALNPERGLAPRVFEAVFQAIEAREGNSEGAFVQYECKCSFLQIYNEEVSDLLCPSENRRLTIRTSSTNNSNAHDVWVDNLSDHVVLNADDAMKLMVKGAACRTTGQTKLNAESSRSHCVFVMRVECRTTLASGVAHVQYGSINLVDLAGSERIKLTGTEGLARVEASQINTSLSHLGIVISNVVEAQESGKARHIPYRNSKLTFLLQDSLGGNSKTFLVANVSPSNLCAHETLSTLQFADRAKCIRNRAKVNTDTEGTEMALQAEVERLREELRKVMQGETATNVHQKCDELKEQLNESKTALHDKDRTIDGVKAEYDQLRDKISIMDERIVARDKELAAVREGQDRALMEVSSIKSSAASDKDRAMATTSELQKRVAQLDQHATHLTDKLHAAEETARAAATTLHAAHASEMQKLREAHAAELQKVREEEREQREYAVAAVTSAHTGEIARLREEKQALSTQVAEARGEGEAALEEKTASEVQLREDLDTLKAAYATQTAQIQSTAASLETERGAFDTRCKEMMQAEASRVRTEEARVRQYALEAVKAAHESELTRAKEDAEQMYSSKVARLREEVVGIFSYESDSTSTVSRSAHVEVSPDDQC